MVDRPEALWSCGRGRLWQGRGWAGTHPLLELLLLLASHGRPRPPGPPPSARPRRAPTTHLLHSLLAQLQRAAGFHHLRVWVWGVGGARPPPIQLGAPNAPPHPQAAPHSPSDIAGTTLTAAQAQAAKPEQFPAVNATPHTPQHRKSPPRQCQAQASQSISPRRREEHEHNEQLAACALWHAAPRGPGSGLGRPPLGHPRLNLASTEEQPKGLACGHRLAHDPAPGHYRNAGRHGSTLG